MSTFTGYTVLTDAYRLSPAPEDVSVVIKEESPGQPETNCLVLDPYAFECSNQEPPTSADFTNPKSAPEHTVIDCLQKAQNEPKKGRKRALETPSPNSSDETKSAAAKAKAITPSLTDLIDKIAAEDTVLKFDLEQQQFVVVDGPGFEARFNELRKHRTKRSNETASRPFSRMHIHYIIVRGERWAGTGTAFRAKQDTVDEFLEGDKTKASQVNVTLLPTDESAGFHVTLQHFLNVTGAGDAYRKAEARAKRNGQSSPDSEETQSPDSVEEEPPTAGLPRQQSADLSLGSDVFWQSMSIDNVSSAVTGIWNSSSRGDQAYFFFRDTGSKPFSNGSVVKLVDGKLRLDNAPSENCVFLVVSDKNAKWKGEPHPSPQEEHKGHWCCFLGQVPVRVRGKVCAGDYLGPKADGSGVAAVVDLGASPVVGIALVGKEGEGEDDVRTMCFAGLNTMNAKVGSNLGAILEEALKAKEAVEELREDFEKSKKETDGKVQTLKERVDLVEQRLAAGIKVKGAGNMGHDVERRIMGACGRGEEEQGTGPFEEHECIEVKDLADVCMMKGVTASSQHVEARRTRKAYMLAGCCIVFVAVVAVALVGWLRIGGGTAVVAASEIVGANPAGGGSTGTPQPMSGLDVTGSGGATGATTGGTGASGGESAPTGLVEAGCSKLLSKGECGMVGGCVWTDYGQDSRVWWGGWCVDEAEESSVSACDELLSDGACGMGEECEWVDLAQEEGGFCIVAAYADAAKCNILSSKEDCEKGIMCEWADIEGYGAEHCAVRVADMFQPECDSRADIDDCVQAAGCMWTSNGETEYHCALQPACDNVSSEKDCTKLTTCRWEDEMDGGRGCVSALEDDTPGSTRSKIHTL